MTMGSQGGAWNPKVQGPSQPYTVIPIPGDAFLQPALANGVFYLTKGSAAAITLAPASSVPVGTEVIIQAGSAFAHVVTVQSGGIFDGTTGAKTKWTSAAFIGSTIFLMAAPNGGWSVLSQQLGTVA